MPRRSPSPKPVLGQSQGVVTLTTGAARFFRDPSTANAFAAYEAKLEVRRLRASARGVTGPEREDWLAVSRFSALSSDEAAWAVEETARFKADCDESLAVMSAGLRDAAVDLAAALGKLSDPAACQSLLAAAKARALDVERLHRKARSAAHESANVVSGLKSKEVAKRLSQAAEALQQAADRIAEILGVRA